jgi:hypothetical protein
MEMGHKSTSFDSLLRAMLECDLSLRDIAGIFESASYNLSAERAYASRIRTEDWPMIPPVATQRNLKVIPGGQPHQAWNWRKIVDQRPCMKSCDLSSHDLPDAQPVAQIA